MRRELIRGELREKEMTPRDRFHSHAKSRLVQALTNWLDTRPAPRGEVAPGEAGYLLKREPASAAGIDVAHVGAEVAERNSAGPDCDGAPVLAVEILAPCDTQEEIDEKILPDLETGVAQAWVVNPRFQTVTAHRPDGPPVQFNEAQELSGEPHLPGFDAAVHSLCWPPAQTGVQLNATRRRGARRPGRTQGSRRSRPGLPWPIEWSMRKATADGGDPDHLGGSVWAFSAMRASMSFQERSLKVLRATSWSGSGGAAGRATGSEALAASARMGWRRR